MKHLFLLCLAICLGTSSLYAQNFTISGKVVDEKSETIVGVNVYLRHTHLGNTSDLNGKFEIKRVPAGSYVLTCSAVGMESLRQSIEVKENISGLVLQMKEGNEKLEAVVVTGTGTRHKLSEAPVQTELIGEKVIKQLAPQRVEDLLLNLSPSFEFSPNSMGSNLSLNGLDNRYVLIMIDGKRMHGDVGGNNDLNRINPEDIERIEVVKGASSSLYGSEAVGGVVNIITKRSKNMVNITNSSQYQEYGQYQQSNSIGLNLGKFSLVSKFSRKQNDGWQLSEFELEESKATEQDTLVETASLAQNAYTDHTFSQSLSYEPNSKLKLDAFVSHFTKDVRRPDEAADYGYYYEDLSYSLGGSYKLNKKASLRFDMNADNYLYFYRYNKDYKSYKEDQLVQNNDQTRYEGNLKSTIKLHKSHLLNVGAQFVQEQMASDRLISDKETAFTWAAYAQDEFKLTESTILVGGLRLTSHEKYGEFLTPKINLMQKLGRFNIRMSYSHGYKSPTMKQLFYEYHKRTSLYLGNQDLEPEKSKYYSGSIEFIQKRMHLSLTAYRNDLDNMIISKSIDVTSEMKADGIKKALQYTNTNEARTQGIDFLADFRLPYGLNLGGGYSYVDAQNLSEDIRIEGVAKHYGNVRVAWTKNFKKYKLNASITGRLQDEKFYADEDNAKAYNIWKLSTNHSFRLTRGVALEVTAGVDNIFDKVDRSPYGSRYGSLNPGRSLFAGVRIKFWK